MWIKLDNKDYMDHFVNYDYGTIFLYWDSIKLEYFINNFNFFIYCYGREIRVYSICG